MDVFVHIPRTGGQCLSQLVLQNYRNPLFTGDSEAEIRDLRAVPPQCEALMGHIPNGLFAGARHVTLLRHPIDRLVSEYRFHATTPAAYHHEQIKAGLTIDAWFRRDSHTSDIIDNALCRFVSGAYVWQDVSRRILARAKEALCHAAFGLTERFDESALLIARDLGWRHVFAVPTNAKQPLSSLQVSPSDDALYRFDAELYAFAVDLFQDRIDRLGSLFVEALDAYRKTMRILSVSLPHAHGDTLGYEQPPPLIKALKGIQLSPPVLHFLET